MKPKLFNLNFNYWAITLIFSLITFNACSSTIVRGDADVSQQQPTATSGTWTWVSGDSTSYEMGDYGSQGVTAGTNKPGARCEAIGWIDSTGNLWLFGGHGNANISWKVPNIYGYRLPKATGAGYLNDFWKFDGTNWTWVSGDNTASYNPHVPEDNAKEPHSRYGGIGLTDGDGKLWLFGGDAKLRYGSVANDLWKFKP